MAPLWFDHRQLSVISSLPACQCLSVSNIKFDSYKSGNITFTLVSHPLFSHAAPLTPPGLMSAAYAGVEHSRLNHLALRLELCRKSFIQIKFSSPLWICCLHKLRSIFFSKKMFILGLISSLKASGDTLLFTHFCFLGLLLRRLEKTFQTGTTDT